MHLSTHTPPHTHTHTHTPRHSQSPPSVEPRRRMTESAIPRSKTNDIQPWSVVPTASLCPLASVASLKSHLNCRVRFKACTGVDPQLTTTIAVPLPLAAMTPMSTRGSLVSTGRAPSMPATANANSARAPVEKLVGTKWLKVSSVAPLDLAKSATSRSREHNATSRQNACANGGGQGQRLLTRDGEGSRFPSTTALGETLRVWQNLRLLLGAPPQANRPQRSPERCRPL